MAGCHIHIKGRVQGVGYRPLVHQLALQSDVNGWVSNGNDGLHIEASGRVVALKQFYQACIDQAPARAKITSHHYEAKAIPSQNGFHIRASDPSSPVDLAISPDFALCSACREELHAGDNRRADYAFVTCAQCGPRYSVMTGLPYDRPQTTMQAFEMCTSCQQEYNNLQDRRYFAQTNSCPDCGISMQLHNRAGNTLSKPDAILEVLLEALESGQIVALKGIGGYLLLCDAQQAEAVKKLRQRKQRPSKPFALLFPDVEAAGKAVYLHHKSREALQSAAAPIVLAPIRKPGSELAADVIAPGLEQLGVMLPYAPLLEWIARAWGTALIATSANTSGAPIVHQDAPQDITALLQLADLVLSHNRAIAMPQDDSLLSFSPVLHQPTLLRRSRGYAPAVYTPMLTEAPPLLAMGAALKGSFALCNDAQYYLSQYLGDLESYERQEHYRHCLHLLKQYTKTEPAAIITDLHPGYYSSHYGEQLAQKWGLPQVKVQHHEAHLAALIGEHQLQKSAAPLLGVVWDGTGLGSDGQLWGSEFFAYQDRQITRLAHLPYFTVIAGDKMAREPRLSALSVCEPAFAERRLKKEFTPQQWQFYSKARQQQTLQTSSMGRLFDALASLLGLSQVNAYEGQAAILLEQAARQYLQAHDWQLPAPFAGDLLSQEGLQSMLQEVCETAGTVADGLLAARFHLSLVAMIRRVAERGNYQHIALSGGVFQNALLSDLIRLQLGDQYQLYLHEQLPPNDENLAFGQLIYHQLGIQSSTSSVNTKTKISCA